jgi:hypothetical protein
LTSGNLVKLGAVTICALAVNGAVIFLQKNVIHRRMVAEIND